MDVYEFLRLGGADIPSLLASIDEIVGLEADDVLLVVGSLAEDSGSRKSDLDLLLITSRGAAALPSQDEVIWALGTCVVDVRILSTVGVARLFARLDQWSSQPWDVSNVAKFTHDERVLLHRLRHGRLLSHREGVAHDRVLRPDGTALACLKLQVACHAARTIQVDMMGYKEVGDYRTLVFAAQKLLGHAIDALLAGYRQTNPLSKWRSRALARLPADWEAPLLCRPSGLSAADLFWRLQRTPEHPDEHSSLAYAYRICAFARAAFPWAERQLIGDAFVAPNPLAWPQTEGGPSDVLLPALEFDVGVSLTQSGLKASRLNEFGTVLDLSAQDLALLLLFDGMTTAEEARLVVYGFADIRDGMERVEQMLSRVADAELCAPGFRPPMRDAASMLHLK